MPVNYLGGYFLASPTVCRVMKTLQIDDKGLEYWRMDYPINDWLAKQGKENVYAFALYHDGGDGSDNHGIVLVTQFQRLESIGENVVFEEGEKDKRVKEWLMNDGGAKESDLEWKSVCDIHGHTSEGLVPTENNISASDTFVLLTGKQREKFLASRKAHWRSKRSASESEGL